MDGESKKIHIRAAARRDLLKHYDYLEQMASNSVADRFLSTVAESLELLVDNPEMGASAKLASPKLRGVRIWPLRHFTEYILFYAPTDRGISLLRVIHAKQDYPRLFR